MWLSMAVAMAGQAHGWLFMIGLMAGSWLLEIADQQETCRCRSYSGGQS